MAISGEIPRLAWTRSLESLAGDPEGLDGGSDR